MALMVKDILELPSGQKMQLLAGGKGLNRPVVSVEIADYEFAPDVTFTPGIEFDLQETMDPASFIITSFLFAKDDPSAILTAVKTLHEMGMAALAFKRIIYNDLPDEVLEYAEQNDFPILSFGRDVWFENIVFDIMYAVQFDDKVYLSEEKINTMLSGYMNRSELDIIIKGISLKLRRYVSVVYISGEAIDAGRILRSFYLLKGFQEKGLMVRYGDGLFLIITSASDDVTSHDLIRREFFEVLGIDANTICGMSNVHDTAELDQAFRESRYSFITSSIKTEPLVRFCDSGIHQVLLPALDHAESAAFAKKLLDGFRSNPDLMETAREYALLGGDIARVATSLHCHQNTIRYRLGRIRELTGLQDATDSELYLQMKSALIIDSAKAVRNHP